MIKLNDIVNTGSSHLPFSQANKVRISNIIAILTIVISALYTSYYALVHNVMLVAIINGLFTFAYAGTIFFNRLYMTKASKIWFFSILMLHLIVCTNLYVTKDSGFHLYLFLVPTGAFLLFNNDENKERITLSLIALLIFFYCENTINLTPMINLSSQMNHLLYQSVIFVNMVEVIIVLTIFIRQIESNERQLVEQANNDALTGIANRRYFFEQSEFLTKLANRNRRPISLIMIDFDFFKSINDTHGHIIGDLCLKEMTTVIKNMNRTHDVFARFGGEEFVLLLPETTLIEAVKLAERIRLAVAEKTIVLDLKNNIHCTASFGVSCNKDFNEELKLLIINADSALLKAKEQGRNRVLFFNNKLCA